MKKYLLWFGLYLGFGLSAAKDYSLVLGVSGYGTAAAGTTALLWDAPPWVIGSVLGTVAGGATTLGVVASMMQNSVPVHSEWLVVDSVRIQKKESAK
jgi:hypothetical protein